MRFASLSHSPSISSPGGARLKWVQPRLSVRGDAFSSVGGESH